MKKIYIVESENNFMYNRFGAFNSKKEAVDFINRQIATWNLYHGYFKIVEGTQK